MKKHSAAMLFMTLSGSAFADHPSTTIETGSGSPIVTISGAVMPAGGWAFSLRSQYIDNDELNDEVLAAAAFAGDDVHSIRSLTNWTLNVAYGVSDAFTLTASLPYVQRRRQRKRPSLPHRHRREARRPSSVVFRSDRRTQRRKPRQITKCR